MNFTKSKVSVTQKILIIVICLLGVGIPMSAKTMPIRMNLNGKMVSLDKGAIYIDKGNTMVPLRFIAQSIGAVVDYTEQDKCIRIQKDDANIVLKVGERAALRDGQKVELAVAPQMRRDSVMVPLRFVSEALQIYTHYDEEDKVVYLSTLHYEGARNIVGGYMLAIETIYDRNKELKDAPTYIAIDTGKMRYLSEEDKQQLFIEMGRYGIVIEATYQELQEQGFIQEGVFREGSLITINDLYSEGNQLILDIRKWQANLGSEGYLKMILTEEQGTWYIEDDGVWFES
ncbi:MAG: copper amine oxidase N-terminal domain-containing protein [Cellulosilyticaceae bacterium]